MKLSIRVVLSCCLAALVLPLEAGSRTLTKPSFDPDAREVELFSAMEEKAVEAWLIPENETRGYVFVENKTDESLTVHIPGAFVGVQNLKQFFQTQQQNGNGVGNGIFTNTGNNQNQGAQAGNQPVGGGVQQNQQTTNGPNFNNGPGGNNNFTPGNSFFSIPPQTRVKLPFHSVCLAHGLKTPNRMKRYSLIPVEQFTQNEDLQELLSLVATGRVQQKTAQAATWHLTDGLSFAELSRKKEHHLGGATTQFFTQQDLNQAGELLKFVEDKVADREKEFELGTSVVDFVPDKQAEK